MLFNNLTEIFPNSEYSPKRKFEAVERLLIYLTILCFLLTGRIQTLVVGIISVCFVHIAFKILRKKTKENFETQKREKTSPAPTNPFMNVMLTDYIDNPLKAKAKDSWLPVVEGQINNNAFNPDIYNDSRVFKDLGENIDFEQSMRQFYTTASTTIPNNQHEFAKFCYGNMPSCKEGDAFQCAKNNTNNRKVIY
jgi:hypothetical protein